MRHKTKCQHFLIQTHYGTTQSNSPIFLSVQSTVTIISIESSTMKMTRETNKMF